MNIKYVKKKLKSTLLQNEKLKQSYDEKVTKLKMVQNRLYLDSNQITLSSEVVKLRTANVSMRKDLTKFVEGSSKLDMLLKYMRYPFSKESLGFLEDKNENSYDLLAKLCRRCGKGNYIEVTSKEPIVSGLNVCKIYD